LRHIHKGTGKNPGSLHIVTVITQFLAMCCEHLLLVRNLGVLFDINLSFESHVSSKISFFHLKKKILKLHNLLSMTNAEQLVCAFMTSRLLL